MTLIAKISRVSLSPWRRGSRSRIVLILGIACFFALMSLFSDYATAIPVTAMRDMRGFPPTKHDSTRIREWQNERSRGQRRLVDRKPGSSASPAIAQKPSNPSPVRDDIIFDDKAPDVNYNCHIFYYTNYGLPNVERHGSTNYSGWNYIRYQAPHDEVNALRYGTLPRAAECYEAPQSIASSYYPDSGVYDSRDLSTVERHMADIRKTGCGVVSVSWWPETVMERRGWYAPTLYADILDAAHRQGLKVSLHSMPFQGRKAQMVPKLLDLFLKRHGDHPALYRDEHRSNRPWVFVNDAVKIPGWSDALSNRDSSSSSFLFIAEIHTAAQRQWIIKEGFDGFYTGHTSDGAGQASNSRNWARQQAWADRNGVIFLPTIGPGYNDIRVRPYNKLLARERQNGAHYDHNFGRAIACCGARAQAHYLDRLVGAKDSQESVDSHKAEGKSDSKEGQVESPLRPNNGKDRVISRVIPGLDSDSRIYLEDDAEVRRQVSPKELVSLSADMVAKLPLGGFPALSNSYLGIASYNNWLDGTQIEPARRGQHNTSGFDKSGEACEVPVTKDTSDMEDKSQLNYLDYGTVEPDYYLNRTRDLLREFLSPIPLTMKVTPGGDHRLIHVPRKEGKDHTADDEKRREQRAIRTQQEVSKLNSSSKKV
eukprot:Clim_evm3s222 gene=Clim_evmTU3s222